MEKEWKLNPKQVQFLEAKEKYVCNWGGRGSGKSFALVSKAIQLSIEYPNNYGLIGRFNYSDLRDSTEKDFFDVCPAQYIKGHNKQERQVTFFNGSQIIFRGLKDIKKTEIRSLNLGFVMLDQAEEIDESLVDELAGGMRRRVVDYDGNEMENQMFVVCNPVINWIYKRFVQEKLPNHLFIQSSTLDNAQNLKESFLKDLMSKPESWKRVFIYGELDESLVSGRNVFPSEYVEAQANNVRSGLRKIEDIIIFKDRQEGHIYQLGIDPSEGAEDSSVVKAIDTITGEEVAKWEGKIQPDLLAFKAVKMGDYFYKAKMVLEINGIGLATLTKLKELNYENLYWREEFDHISKAMTQKLGWRTTHASKPLLTGHFTELMSTADENGNLKEPFAKIRDSKTVAEMKTFVHSPEASKRGMGAEKSFHDDNIMATMLAYWDVKPNNNQQNQEFVSHSGDYSRRDEDEDLFHLENILTNGSQKKWLEM